MDVSNSSSKLDKYWVDSPNQCHYDRNLNFAAIGSEDDEAYSSFSKKPKSARDPQSHRIIEKRRRDRMNNCLADLSRLLPVAYMKKGRGRIEKTEIIEMTIKHMKHLQVHACKEMESCEIAVQMEQLHSNTKSDQYRSGFFECISETVKFIVRQHLQPVFMFQLKSLGNEEEEVASTVSASISCAPPQPVDQYKSPTEGDNEKIKDERVKEMFIYLNGASEHHRQQQQHSNGPRAARSSSGSGGDSDESRSNRATRNSDTPSPNHPTTDGSSPTDMDNSSHSGGSNHSSSRSGNSSQLRQMLLASNGESSSTSRTKSCSSSSSGRSNTTQMSTEDSSNMYKFKTNIHQRFTADLEHVFPQSSCLMTPSSTSSLPEQQVQSSHHSQQSFEPGHGLKRKLSGCERHNNLDYGWNPDVLPPPPVISSRSPRLRCEESEEMPLPSEVALQQQQQQYQQHTNGALENVPIFALHPKGAFYVPMSVELPLIQGLFNSAPTSENAQPLLHPVTISVNFCHPAAYAGESTSAHQLDDTTKSSNRFGHHNEKRADTPTESIAESVTTPSSGHRHESTARVRRPSSRQPLTRLAGPI
nr:EOG090X0J7Y [Scapholeberis mucronata]